MSRIIRYVLFTYAALVVASLISFGVWGVTWWAPLPIGDPIHGTGEGVARLLLLMALHFGGVLAFSVALEMKDEGKKT